MEVIAIDKSYYNFLFDFIQSNNRLLMNSKVIIFGAGIRGYNLMRILELSKITNIAFVDNDPQKQGEKINGYCIYSFDEVINVNCKSVFLCPVEKGAQIFEQLEQAGFKKNIDYFNLDNKLTDYIETIEEFKRPVKDYIIFFGSCELSSFLLSDTFDVSLAERLKQHSLPEKCKVFALPGMTQRMHYNMINALLKNSPKPKLAVLMLEMSLVSPHAHLMLEPQYYTLHSKLIESLIDIYELDDEINEYAKIINNRLERSLGRGGLSSSPNLEDEIKRKIKLTYNYEIRGSNESVIYLIKTLELLKENNIPAIITFPPINYQLGENLCGSDFSRNYANIIKKLLTFLTAYDYDVIDASFAADSSNFIEQLNSTNLVILNTKGQSNFIDFIFKNEAIKSFLHEVSTND